MIFTKQAKMKYLILFLILVITHCSVGQECTLINNEDGSELTFTSQFPAQIIGTFSKIFSIGDPLPGVYKAYNIRPVEIQPSNSFCTNQYFDMTYEDSILSFKLNQSFKNFDEDVAAQDEDVKDCIFNLKVEADPQCTLDKTTIALQYNVKDSNQNKPKFSKDQYNLQVTFPIPKKISLVKLAIAPENISATDIDFSTKNLAFEIVEENAKKLFDLVALQPYHHQFPVDIRSNALMYLQEPFTFTLRATDDGTDPAPLTGDTKVTISPTEDSDAPLPQFDEPFYQVKVDVQSVPLGSPVNTEPIKFKGTYRALNVVCNGDGSANEYFKCDPQDEQVNVIVIKQPDEVLWKQSQVIVLTISATTTNEGGVVASENTAPFIITLENIPEEETTTTTETTVTTTTETTDTTTTTETTDTTTTTGTAETTTTTETTETTDTTTTTETTDTTTTTETTDTTTTTETTDTTTTTETTDTTTDDMPPETTPQDNTCDETDPDSDLITIIIILSIIILVLLIALIYGYVKYVRRQRTGDKTHLLQTNSDSDSNNNSDNNSVKISESDRDSIDSEHSKPLDVLPDKDEIPIQNEIDRMPKGLDRLIAEQEENNLLKPAEVKSRKRSMTFSESDDESRQYRENLSGPVTAEIINENKPDPVRKKSVVTFKL